MDKSHVSQIFNNIFLTSNSPSLWLCLFGITLYLHTLNFGFSPLDDNYLYLDNLRWFMQFKNILSVFTTSIAGFYRPVLFLSFFPDALTGSGSPLPFHLTNLTFHIIASIMLFQLLLRLDISKFTSFFLSLIFLVHPVNIQTIAWIPGRNDSLLAIFTIGTILILFQFRKTHNRSWFYAHLLTYGCALFTKENAIIIPVFLYAMLSDYFNRRVSRWILAAWGILTGVWFIIQRSLVNEFSVTDFSHPGASIIRFFQAWIFNTGKMIFPFRQALLPTTTDTPVFPYLWVIIFFISIVLYFGVYRRRLFLFGLVWYILFLIIPSLWSSIDKIGEYYEHRLYLPLIGLLIMVSTISVRKISLKVNTVLPVVTGVITLLIFIGLTNSRSQLYADKLTFAEACVKESPTHARSYKLLGTALAEEGRYEEAVINFDHSILLNPDDEASYYNRGSSLFQLGDFQKAIADYTHAINIKPVYFEAYNNRGIIFGNLGQPIKAKADFDFVIANDPKNDKAYNNKGLNYYRMGKITEALDCFDTAIELNDQLEFAFNNRGQIYLDLDQLERAIHDFNRAIELNPLYLSPVIGRAKIYLKLKLDNLAQKDIDYVKKLQPDFSPAEFFGTGGAR